MNPQNETGWLPDFLYVDGAFEAGLAMFAGPDGRISRFSRSPDDLRRAVRLTARAMLPGMIDCHSHAFQRVIRGRTERRSAASRDTFWTWRESMYHAANRLDPGGVYASARMAFLEMLLSGITTVGEFHYLHHGPGGFPYDDRNLLATEVLRAAGDVGLRIALLRTAYVRAGWMKDADPGQARFLTPRASDFIDDTENLRSDVRRDAKPGRAWVGVAPHSVRAVPLDYLREAAAYAKAENMPLHMHVAEQPAEIDACLDEHGVRPVELLARERILDGHFTAVHAVHIVAEEIVQLGSAGASLCACPTTERNLGDGALAADRLIEAGAEICLGSDSNAQIDLLEDARTLEYNLRMAKLERAVLAPDEGRESLAKRLFHCATEAGAASLRAPGGKLAAGFPADFFTVDLNDVALAGADRFSLLSHVVFAGARAAVRDVYVDGEAVVRDGRHPLQDEIAAEFAVLQRELWGPAR